MPDPTSRLRSQARRFENRRKPTGTRYPTAFRAEVAALARGRIAEGVSVARIARDLGLRPKTLALWLRRTAVPRLRRVRVEGDPWPAPVASETRPIVVTPGGLRIEGLDLASVARLVRSLA
jgi:transposase-like protein